MALPLINLKATPPECHDIKLLKQACIFDGQRIGMWIQKGYKCFVSGIKPIFGFRNSGAKDTKNVHFIIC